jgi:hypothetical protein
VASAVISGPLNLEFMLWNALVLVLAAPAVLALVKRQRAG